MNNSRLMLETNKVRKVYQNGGKSVEVLKGIDVSIEKGSFTAVIGPSGAGKSTLLHILGGLDAPSEGAVSFEGEDMYRLSDGALSAIRNEKIGFVFQFYHLLPECTVLENVLMPFMIRRNSAEALKEVKLRSVELLKQAGLEERITHFPSQLSGGEQQRVAIVRALTNKPRLLLCDEPTGNLDSKTGEGIIALIRKAHDQQGMTVVFVTHNIELAKSADKIYSLKDGLLVS